MYKLTSLRKEKAREILDRYNHTLQEKGKIDVTSFELELRESWSSRPGHMMGYQNLKGIIIDMYCNSEYSELALFYMKKHPVAEFTRYLVQK